MEASSNLDGMYMAGKPGMHKKLLNPAAMEKIRLKIDAEKIINTLTNHVIDGKEMSGSQVTAALGLLKKTIPDLSAVEYSGAGEDGAIKMIHTIKLRGF